MKDNADYEISKEDILDWEFRNKRKIDKLVVLWTGWASKWADKEKYLGTKTNNISLLHFPGIEFEFLLSGFPLFKLSVLNIFNLTIFRFTPKCCTMVCDPA